MSTLFTDIDAAIEEGHFIQNHLRRTAYLVCDSERNLHVFENKEFLPVQSEYQVIEIFHRGGCKREYDRLLPEYPYS